jgi:teichuronic acid biosynthesis glycosyltransferase TuaG
MTSNSIDNTLISIITPAYRVQDIIQETINSVHEQTYQNWELLIADDCSPDNTQEIIMNASQKDPRIKLIKCAQNGGPAKARNAALAVAKGRWIAFLDSDDLWLPTKLSETIDYAISTNSALTFTGFRRINFNNDLVGSYIATPRTLTYKQLLGNTAIATSTVLIDRSKVGEIVMQPVYYDDFVCWLGILKKGYQAHGLNRDLMRYRVTPKSVSRNKLRSAKEVWKTYRSIEKINLFNAFLFFTKYSINAIKKYSTF